METLLLFTIVVASLIFPVVGARDPDPRRAIRRLVVVLLVFNAFYLIYVTRFHPIWFVPERPWVK